MSFFKKLFGGGDNAKAVKAEPVEYKGYQILTTPMKDGGQFRVCGIISKEVDGVNKEHTLIRADTLPSIEAANEMTVKKAKQMISEQGDRLFN